MIDGGADGRALTVVCYKEQEYPAVLQKFFANFKN